MDSFQFTELIKTINVAKIGGKTDVIIPTITTSAGAYSAGDCVGGLITLDGAMKSIKGTGVLKSIHVKDAANQSADLTILIFSETPTGATTEDSSAFAYGSTSILKQIAKINVAAADYETVDSIATADIDAIGKVIRATGETNSNLFAVVVTTGTPTYGAGANKLMINFGILQD